MKLTTVVPSTARLLYRNSSLEIYFLYYNPTSPLSRYGVVSDYTAQTTIGIANINQLYEDGIKKTGTTYSYPMYGNIHRNIEFLPDSRVNIWTNVYSLNYASEHGQIPASYDRCRTLYPELLPELQEEGYIFGGWYYDASFSNPTTEFDIISSDTTLYAKWEEQPNRSLDVTYNSSKIIDSAEVTPPVTVSYNGSTIASLNAGDAKTLQCNGKVMASDVVIGDKTLQCNGKLMASDVVVEVGE